MKISWMSRREFLRKLSLLLGGLGIVLKGNWIEKIFSEETSLDSVIDQYTLPLRILGKTGQNVTALGLGGEGVLRTYGRMKEAVLVIQKALDLGINYFDTAPAYSQSQDYYGEALGERRKDIFLASKTHDRTRDGSLRLLEDSLRRLKTDHLDLWQLHDLRTKEDLDQIFDERHGAIRALEEARTQKLVRFFGVTGHHDPQILVEALRRYSFDTALVAMNVADRHGPSFIDSVFPAAVEKGVGVIGMKVLARGEISRAGISPREAMGYVLSLPVSTVIVGCSSPREVEENVRIVKTFSKFFQDEMSELEKRSAPFAGDLCFYKG